LYAFLGKKSSHVAIRKEQNFFSEISLRKKGPNRPNSSSQHRTLKPLKKLDLWNGSRLCSLALLLEAFIAIELKLWPFYTHTHTSTSVLPYIYLAVVPVCPFCVDRGRVEFNHNRAASNEIPDPRPVEAAAAASLDSLLGAIMEALMRESTLFCSIRKLVKLMRLSQYILR
jgi:hypothetical protein